MSYHRNEQVAIALGWTRIDGKAFSWLPPAGYVGKSGAVRQPHKRPPDFQNSIGHILNAMLTLPQAKQNEIIAAIERKLNEPSYRASAADWCDAIIDTQL